MRSLKKVKFGIIGLMFVLVILFGSQIVIYYQLKVENEKLLELKTRYIKLSDEIAMYNELRSYYILAIDEEKGLNVDREILQNKVNNLEQEILSLQGKIGDIKKKIDDIS